MISWTFNLQSILIIHENQNTNNPIAFLWIKIQRVLFDGQSFWALDLHLKKVENLEIYHHNNQFPQKVLMHKFLNRSLLHKISTILLTINSPQYKHLHSISFSSALKRGKDMHPFLFHLHFSHEKSILRIRKTNIFSRN